MTRLSITPETDGDYKCALLPIEDNIAEQLNRARVRFIINKPPPLNDIRKTCTHKTSIVCVKETSEKNIMADEKSLGTNPACSCDGICDAELCTGLRQLKLVNKMKGNKRAETKHLCDCRGLRSLILVDKFKEANTVCGASKEGCKKA